MCIYEMSAFPDIFLRGNTKKNMSMSPTGPCRQNFADIVGCRRHVGDMLPTFATARYWDEVFDCITGMVICGPYWYWNEVILIE
jgi:hypothetical protein